MLACLMIVLPARPALTDDFFGSSEHEAQILPVDDAFHMGFIVDESETRVFWQVMPGYFLYRDKFEFEAGDELLDVAVQEGEWRQDEIFGRVQVLDGLVEVSIPTTGAVRVRYQGCAAQGFCYPPQEKLVKSGKFGEK
jgi:thiol:disulfide interchange protein DsbD